MIGQPQGGGGHQDSHPGHPDGHLGHPVQLHHSPVVSSPVDMKLESLHSEPPSYLSYQVHNKFYTLQSLGNSYTIDEKLLVNSSSIPYE